MLSPSCEGIGHTLPFSPQVFPHDPRAHYTPAVTPITRQPEAHQVESLAEGEPMGNLSGVVGHLQKELKRAQHDVQRYTAALAALGSSASNGLRALSASARRKISLAQKKRWAKAHKGSQKTAGAAKTTAAVPAKRTMSASARRKIAAAQRARWARVKAGKKAA
jgi:hypothetical protein